MSQTLGEVAGGASAEASRLVEFLKKRNDGKHGRSRQP
jgi:hypothetical protein